MEEIYELLAKNDFDSLNRLIEKEGKDDFMQILDSMKKCKWIVALKPMTPIAFAAAEKGLSFASSIKDYEWAWRNVSDDNLKKVVLEKAKNLIEDLETCIFVWNNFSSDFRNLALKRFDEFEPTFKGCKKVFKKTNGILRNHAIKRAHMLVALNEDYVWLYENGGAEIKEDLKNRLSPVLWSK